MPRRSITWLFVFLASLCCLAPRALAQDSLAVPFRFEPQGTETEKDAKATYIARGSRYSVYLTGHDIEIRTRPQAVKLTFEGSNTRTVQPLEKLNFRSHYYSDEPARSRSDVPAYGRLVYENVYP